MPRTSQCEPWLRKILAMKAQGLTLKAIASRLGLRYGMVVPFCTRRGIRFPKNRGYKVDDRRLPALLASGATHDTIATHFGVTRGAIERRAAKLGLQTARTGPRSGPGHREWQGGRRLAKFGYVLVYAPLHPQANGSTSTVAEHRLVMEVVLGRYLRGEEVVHHRDNHPTHNWPSNLEVFASNGDHLRAELTARPQSTPRMSIPGAYRSHQSTRRCPDVSETLAQCPSEIRAQLAWYIESHRPTTAHQSFPRRWLLRQGAWRDPFPMASTA